MLCWEIIVLQKYFFLPKEKFWKIKKLIYCKIADESEYIISLNRSRIYNFLSKNWYTELLRPIHLNSRISLETQSFVHLQNQIFTSGLLCPLVSQNKWQTITLIYSQKLRESVKNYQCNCHIETKKLRKRR